MIRQILVLMLIGGTWPLVRTLIWLQILKEVAQYPAEIPACLRGVQREKILTVSLLVIYFLFGFSQWQYQRTIPYGLILLTVVIGLTSSILLWSERQLKLLAAKQSEAG